MFILGFDDTLTNVKFHIDEEVNGNQYHPPNDLFNSIGGDTLFPMVDQGSSIAIDERVEDGFVNLLKQFETEDTEVLKRIIEEEEQSI